MTANIKPIRIFLLVAIIGFTWACSNSQNIPELNLTDDKIEEIDSVVEILYENEQFQGTVLVSVRGKVIYKKGVGFANIKDSIPNTIYTKFHYSNIPLHYLMGMHCFYAMEQSIKRLNSLPKNSDLIQTET